MADDDRRRFLLLPDVARELNRPLNTVRHWARIGTLTSFRLGRRRVVERTDLELFIAQAKANAPANDNGRGPGRN